MVLVSACCLPLPFSNSQFFFSMHLLAAGEVPGLWNLGKSYMSLDTDGRVVRLDSFAKFLAPGFRLGWLTAHPHFVDKFTFHMHGTALGPCSTTQVIHVTLGWQHCFMRI